MSYSTIVYIYPGDKIEEGPELRNSHGTAPPVWEAIHTWYGDKSDFHWMQGIDKLWGIYKNKDILFYRRAVFMMTFDKAYIAKKYYQRAANDIRAFFHDWEVNPDHVNHWPFIADYFASAPDIPGIGLWCTSVSDNPFAGHWNDEIESYDPPNWDDIYSLYDVLIENDTICHRRDGSLESP